MYDVGSKMGNFYINDKQGSFTSNTFSLAGPLQNLRNSPNPIFKNKTVRLLASLGEDSTYPTWFHQTWQAGKSPTEWRC